MKPGRLERALADGYRFKLYSFWQPLLTYGHKPLVPFEQQMARADASRIPADYACLQMMTATYAEAELRAAQTGRFIFFGGVFDSTSDPVWSILIRVILALAATKSWPRQFRTT